MLSRGTFGVPLLVLLGACAVPAETTSPSEAALGKDGWENEWKNEGWPTTEIALRPDMDEIDYEAVSAAIDRQGGRHLAFVGADLLVHYVGPTGAEKIFDEINADTARPRLALGADGQPRIAFTSDPYSLSGGPIIFASRAANGTWRVERTGKTGEVDALAVDETGTVHIASSDLAPAPAYWRAFVTTGKPGASSGATAFAHTEVPRMAGGTTAMSSYNAFGLVVDRTGAEFLVLATSPLSLGSGFGPATFFARRSAGGSFRVEKLGVEGGTGSLARDADGTLHVVVSSRGLSGTHALYLRRGVNDTAWSAPDPIDPFRTSYYTSMAVDARGRVHVAWSTNDARELVYAERGSAGNWMTETVFRGHAQLPSLALDPSGKPVIAYRSGPSYWVAAP